MDALLKRIFRTCRHIFLESVSFVYRKFLQPKSLTEDERRREYILNIILLGSVVMLILLDGFSFYYHITRGGSHPGALSPFIFSLLPLFFIFLQLLSRRGHFVAASYLLIAAYFLSNSYAVYRWGIQLQPALLGYALLILIASILIDTRFGFITTGTIAAFMITLWYFQEQGVIPVEQTIHNDDEAVVFSVLYILMMVVAWLSNREIEKSLARARTSEQKLTEQRDLLEVAVEERTRELRETQFEKVKEVYRFAEFGQLASGLFHDLLNLLNTISLRSEHHQPTEDARKHAHDTAKQVENFMQAMRKQLDHRETVERFSLVAGIEQVIQLLSYKATKEKVHIIFEPARKDAFIYFGNPFAFHQVMINLIINAIDAYENIPRDSDLSRSRSIAICLEGKEEITIRVEDHGSGIPVKIQRKIFEPFFTTKGSTHGTGIGLATTKKIIEEDFHGTIAVQSEEGKGARFTVTFKNP